MSETVRIIAGMAILIAAFFALAVLVATCVDSFDNRHVQQVYNLHHTVKNILSSFDSWF